MASRDHTRASSCPKQDEAALAELPAAGVAPIETARRVSLRRSSEVDRVFQEELDLADDLESVLEELLRNSTV